MSNHGNYRARRALTTDAKNRALRTFLQGLGIDLAVALAMLITTMLMSKNSWGEIEWIVLGFSVFKTVLMVTASFIMRRFIDRDGSVALPPDPPGQPSEPDNSLLPPTQDL
jgi:hypothetical protein